jgi:type I restriction enzyme S subunit
MSDELPQGWVWAKMLDVLDYEGGSQPPKKDFVYEPRDGYVRLIQIRDFGDKPFPTYVPDSRRLKKVNKDDLLLARYGGSSANDSLGRICTGLEGAYNVALAKIIFDRKHMDKNYVRYLFMGPWFREKVSQNSRSCQTGFNREDVEDIEFPIAPSAEQRRIAAKLEKVFGQVDACQQRLEKLPTLLKRFRQSVLAAACSGRLTADWREENPTEDAAKLIESVKPARPAKFRDASVRSDLDLAELPESWVWTNLRFLISPAEAFCYGVVQPGENNTDGVFLVRAGDLVAGRVDTSTLRRIPRSIHDDYRRSQLLGGEILVTVVGAGIGETAIAQPECAGFNIARAVAKLPIREFEARYVHLWLSTSCAQNWMKGDSREVARPTLNLEQLQTLPVPIPPHAEQKQIVRRVEGLFALADQLELRLAQARGQVAKLTPALLARVFAGQLVPQNPADEPAEKLLQRIGKARKP